MDEETQLFAHNAWRSRLVSDDAFREIEASGVLGARQRETLRALHRLGRGTAHEIEREAKRTGLWRRISELGRMGVIGWTGVVRPCGVTGVASQEWALTGSRPTKLAPRISDRERRRRWVEWLTHELGERAEITLSRESATRLITVLRG